jgi:hypothetical protein
VNRLTEEQTKNEKRRKNQLTLTGLLMEGVMRLWRRINTSLFRRRIANYLRVRFLNDGDGTGKLLARAEADGFSGESGAYFGVEELESFAKALQEFPLPAHDRRRSIASGFGSKQTPNELEQEHLGIFVYPVEEEMRHA